MNITQNSINFDMDTNDELASIIPSDVVEDEFCVSAEFVDIMKNEVICMIPKFLLFELCIILKIKLDVRNKKFWRDRLKHLYGIMEELNESDVVAIGTWMYEHENMMLELKYDELSDVALSDLRDDVLSLLVRNYKVSNEQCLKVMKESQIPVCLYETTYCLFKFKNIDVEHVLDILNERGRFLSGRSMSYFENIVSNFMGFISNEQFLDIIMPLIQAIVQYQFDNYNGEYFLTPEMVYKPCLKFLSSVNATGIMLEYFMYLSEVEEVEYDAERLEEFHSTLDEFKNHAISVNKKQIYDTVAKKVLKL